MGLILIFHFLLKYHWAWVLDTLIVFFRFDCWMTFRLKKILKKSLFHSFKLSIVLNPSFLKNCLSSFDKKLIVKTVYSFQILSLSIKYNIWTWCCFSFLEISRGYESESLYTLVQVAQLVLLFFTFLGPNKAYEPFCFQFYFPS